MRLLLAASLLLPLAAVAQPYDPAFRWRTFDTPHFQLHFHQGEEALARRVAGAAERAHARLAPVLGFTPEGRTQIVLSDDTDSANGSATPFHYDVIRLFAVAPSGRSELNDYRDWVETLVEHEYAHILHLDNVSEAPAAFNQVFGRSWFPNGLLPAWIIEGIAVLHESAGDPETGRNASALYDMYARALVMEPPGLPPLDVASNPTIDWPVGDVPYLLGGKFMERLQRRDGDAAIAAFAADSGSRIWPWAPSRSAVVAFGEDLPTLWDGLRHDLTERYQRQLSAVRERPVTASAPLSRRGALVENPRWAPDGSALAWLDHSLDERAGIRRATPAGLDLGLATPVDATGSFTLRAPTDAIASTGEVWHEFRYYEDLWRIDLATGRRTRITDGERATDPDVLPGGDTIVYVARTPGGEMELRRRRLDGRAPETLLSRAGAQLYSPRLSPDGGRIAFELHEGGRRDIALLEGGEVRRVTDDDALDLDPAWSPDGKWLFFASDRGGIFNLYAAGADGAVRQVTNVETGALEPAPSPDGGTLAFVGYSRRGYDLATVPLDPASWIDPLPPPPTRAYAPPDDGPVPETRPYAPWATVYPRWWLPFFGADAAGLVTGASTGGEDVLGHHLWALQGWYSWSAQDVGYSLLYQGGWSWPFLDAWSARNVVTSIGLPERLEEEWTPLALGTTFTFTRVGSAAFARLGWLGTSFRTLETVPPVALPPELRFEDGFLSAATLTLAWTNQRRFVRSISPEEGAFAFADLQAAKPWLGSDYDVVRGRAGLGGYLRLPATRHVVLAGRLAGGAARGSLGGRAPYRLGGLSLVELGGPTPTALAIGGSDELRGYLSESLLGNGFVLANAEVRFPLFRPDLGRTTWPLFLRRVNGALFVDAGDAFDIGGSPPLPTSHRFALDTLRFGAGAELRLEVIFGYYIPVELRLGVAQGFGALFGPWEHGHPVRDPAATTQWYLTAGLPF